MDKLHKRPRRKLVIQPIAKRMVESTKSVKEVIQNVCFDTRQFLEAFAVLQKSGIFGIGVEAVLDQHGTATTVGHAVAQNAVVIQIGAIGISAGFDATIGGIHASTDGVIETGGEIGVALGIGNGIVGDSTAHGRILLGWGGTSGGIGVKGEEKNGAVVACQFAAFLQIGVVLNIGAGGEHLKAVLFQLCLQGVCQNEILCTFVIPFAGGVGIAEWQWLVSTTLESKKVDPNYFFSFGSPMDLDGLNE